MKLLLQKGLELVNELSTSKELLRVENLHKSFTTRRNFLGKGIEKIDAVSDVSFSILEGKTTAIVGESGSGKSTTARLAALLEKPDSGKVYVDGTEWTALTESKRRSLRNVLQIVFQDPFGSLDPTKMIVHSVGEPIMIQERISRSELDERVSGLLEQVGLSPDYLHRYPHEFSGGQRQRICIARALSTNPNILFADEAVSALDVSVQAQILDLFRTIQNKRKVGILFISHDLGVVRQIAHDVIVMQSGRIVEQGPVDKVFDDPQDAYTRRLLQSVPSLTRRFVKAN